MKYESKVKYVKLNEISGKEQTVSESYIVNNAETFADAEEQTFKYMAERTAATVIPAIKISDVDDIITGDGDWYYRAKIVTFAIDEINGWEKQIPVVLLFQSDNIHNAMTDCGGWMAKSIVDCELVSLQKTKIVDII